MPAADTGAGPIGVGEARALFAGFDAFPALAVAVSGGRDSMALLRLLARWSSEAPGRPRITALTVDHRLRTGSAADAATVARWCADIGVAHHTLVWTGPRPRTRIEERAREARYALLTGWCRDHAVPALAVAHHLEDQAETVLMRLARASGVDGLAAMAPRSVRDGITVLRPLLGVARARLEATLTHFGQPWIDDPANDDPAFERVRLREGVPHLENLGLSAAAVAASAGKLARAAEALDRIAGDRFEAAVSIESAGFAWIDTEALAGDPDDIVIRVFGRTIEAIAGRARCSDEALSRTALALTRGEGAAATLGRCRFMRSGGRVLVAREYRSLPRCRISPGATLVWDDRFQVSLEQGVGAVEVGALGARGFAEARRLNDALQEVPATAGAALPGGFRGRDLALAPGFECGDRKSALLVRFLRCQTAA